MPGLWKRALEQMGKGKSSPGVQSPCPAQQHCQPGIPQACPSTGRGISVWISRRNPIPCLLKSWNAEMAAPSTAHPWLLWVQLLPALPKNGAAAKGAWTGHGQAGTQQGKASPGLTPHTASLFPCFSHILCAVQVGCGSSRAGTDPKGLLWVGSVPPSHPAWLGNSLPRQRNVIL